VYHGRWRAAALRAGIEYHLLDGIGFCEGHEQPLINRQRDLLMLVARRHDHTTLPILEVYWPGDGSRETQASQPGRDIS
jgi:hypothetical protein